MLIQPYLFLEGRCEEAIGFYSAALGADVQMIMHYRDSPDPSAIRPGLEDKVMHAALRIGQTTIFMSDGRCEADTPASFQGFALSVGADSDADVARMFGALEKDGKVLMPVSATFYASSFGMVYDRFGILWMFMCETKS